MNKRKILFYFLISTLLISNKTFAQEFFEPNNKVGIHVSNLVSEEIKPADILVNSNVVDQSGQPVKQGWGYVTVVVRRDDLDHKKWQDGINLLREKIIPIFRLSGGFNKDSGCWNKLTKDDAIVFADFFTKINNSVRPVYFIIGNEPNHGSEWGCQANPTEYADVYNTFVYVFKNKNPNFYLMPAGLDLYAPQQPPKYYDAGSFMAEMIKQQPDIFKKSDLISAHCYPDADFSGPVGSGRYSLLCYQWLNEYLKNIGAIDSDQKYCITETGYKQGKISEDQIAENIKQAYQNNWLPDQTVRCVTPFLLNYCGEPFTQFSWKKCDTTGYKQVYQTVHDLVKTAGLPPQNETVSFNTELKLTLIADSRYEFPLKFSNNQISQRIYDKNYGDKIELINSPFNYWISDLKNIKPDSSTDLKLILQTGNVLGIFDIKIGLFRYINNNYKLIFELGSWPVTIISAQALTIHLYQFPGFKAKGCDYSVSVRDSNNKIVFSKTNSCAMDGIIYLDNVKGVILGKNYTVTVSRAGYTQVDNSLTITQSANDVEVGLMLPGDRNGDGELNLQDLFL